MLVVIPLHAQLTVDQNGNTLVGNTSETPLSPLSVNYAGNSDAACSVKGSVIGLYSLRSGSAHWGIGSQGVSQNPAGGYSVGIKGVASSSNEMSSGRAYGIMGLASNATNGWNYGVFGRLEGSNNGTAIYGTTNAAENGIYIDGRYAGYFNGPTKIDGDLSVSGAINGVLLGAATSSVNASSVKTLTTTTDNSNEVMTDKLNNLSLNSCYISNSMTANATSVISDSIATTAELSNIEIQSQEKKHYLLSADQLEQEFPDLVYELEDGSKAINYIELIPVLVQTINELNSRLAILESTSSYQKRSIAAIEASLEEDISVGQNTPNPFRGSSTIALTVPSTTKEAFLYFYDLNGVLKKTINITERGNFSITIYASDFENGIYIYSLITDGKTISSNKMIVSK